MTVTIVGNVMEDYLRRPADDFLNEYKKILSRFGDGRIKIGFEGGKIIFSGEYLGNEIEIGVSLSDDINTKSMTKILKYIEDNLPKELPEDKIQFGIRRFLRIDYEIKPSDEYLGFVIALHYEAKKDETAGKVENAVESNIHNQKKLF
jgi:hypothetical protein